MQVVHDFMGNNCVIIYVPARNESHLERGNDIREQGFKLICNKFRDDLVGHIAKANWTELVNSVGVGSFGDKGNEGMVQSF